MRFENGSICSLTYTGRGGAAFPKETVHVCAAGQVMVLSDYKTLDVTGAKTKRFKSCGDKGHYGELVHFEKVLRGQAPWEIPWAPLCAARRAQGLETSQPVDVTVAQSRKMSAGHTREICAPKPHTAA